MSLWHSVHLGESDIVCALRVYVGACGGTPGAFCQ